MAMWRKWGRECRDRGNKRQERSKWEAGVRVREGGGGKQLLYSRSGLSGYCQVTMGKSIPGCCQVTVGVESRENTRDLGCGPTDALRIMELGPPIRSLVSGNMAKGSPIPCRNTCWVWEIST
jgi:hypothetical protein